MIISLSRYFDGPIQPVPFWNCPFYTQSFPNYLAKKSLILRQKGWKRADKKQLWQGNFQDFLICFLFSIVGGSNILIPPYWQGNETLNLKMLINLIFAGALVVSSLDCNIQHSFYSFSYSRTYQKRLKLSIYDVTVLEKKCSINISYDANYVLLNELT